jgi:hypothetical protein
MFIYSKESIQKETLMLFIILFIYLFIYFKSTGIIKYVNPLIFTSWSERA